MAAVLRAAAELPENSSDGMQFWGLYDKIEKNGTREHKGGNYMDDRFQKLQSSRNAKTQIEILKGHFATSHSHLNTYIDMSTVKTKHVNAQETAKELAGEYMSNTCVNTIVCLDETEVIGTFMASYLADSNHLSLSAGNNISVVTPEFASG